MQQRCELPPGMLGNNSHDQQQPCQLHSCVSSWIDSPGSITEAALAWNPSAPELQNQSELTPIP